MTAKERFMEFVKTLETEHADEAVLIAIVTKDGQIIYGPSGGPVSATDNGRMYGELLATVKGAADDMRTRTREDDGVWASLAFTAGVTLGLHTKPTECQMAIESVPQRAE